RLGRISSRLSIESGYLPLADRLIPMADRPPLPTQGVLMIDPYEYFDPFDDFDDFGDFADPGGRSALRAERPTNPRNLPCPTCGEPNRQTPADRARGYQCDAGGARAHGGLVCSP